jgi:hypothetical protein
VNAALSLEMLRASVLVERLKFRGQLINSDLPYAYFGSNIVYISKQLLMEGN